LSLWWKRNCFSARILHSLIFRIHWSRAERKKMKTISFSVLFWCFKNCSHSDLDQNPGIFTFARKYHGVLALGTSTCLSVLWPLKSRSLWLWHPAGALLRNHRDKLARHQEKFQSSSGGWFPMGFHHKRSILVENLYSEEVKNSKKKRFSLNFLTGFNVSYYCFGRRQIISVRDTGCKVLTVLRPALDHTSDMSY